MDIFIQNNHVLYVGSLLLNFFFIVDSTNFQVKNKKEPFTAPLPACVFITACPGGPNISMGNGRK